MQLPLTKPLSVSHQSSYLFSSLPPPTHQHPSPQGSPEMIRSMVAADSVPADFDALLAEYTREGLRVLALAKGEATQVCSYG